MFSSQIPRIYRYADCPHTLSKTWLLKKKRRSCTSWWRDPTHQMTRKGMLQVLFVVKCSACNWHISRATAELAVFAEQLDISSPVLPQARIQLGKLYSLQGNHDTACKVYYHTILLHKTKHPSSLSCIPLPFAYSSCVHKVMGEKNIYLHVFKYSH